MEANRAQQTFEVSWSSSSSSIKLINVAFLHLMVMMATKMDCFFLNDNPVHNCQTIDDNQYSNLNLNQNLKCLNVSPIQSNSKSYNNKNCGTASTLKLPGYDNIEGGENPLHLNKPSKISNFSNLINDKTENEESKKLWKTNCYSNTINSSTIYLHIAAYENSAKTDSFNGSKNEDLQKGKSDSIKTEKQIFTAETFVFQNSFEFPRQENERAKVPEVSNFKASQRLLNPNKSSINGPSSINPLPMSSKFDIFELTKHYEDDEKRFVTLLNLLDELWTNTKDEYKKKITKTFVTQIIECFSHENSRFRSDPRLLRAWDLLGQTSNSLGYDAVMQKLDDLGYFKMCPEFYRLWASFYVQNKNRGLFEKVHAKVVEIFPREKAVLNLFTDLAKQLGPKIVSQDDDMTQNFLTRLTSTPTPVIRAPPSRPLNVLSEESLTRSESDRSASSRSESQRSVSSRSESQRSVSSRNDSGLKSSSYIHQTFVVDPTPAKAVAASSSSSDSLGNDPPAQKIPAENYSFTTYLHRDAVCAFGETLPLSQEVVVVDQRPPVDPISQNLNNVEKDFSVFVEEEEPVHRASTTPNRKSIFSNPAIRDSPVMKKPRTRRDSDEVIEPSYDNPFGDIGAFNKPYSASKSVFDSDKAIDDPTISGFNKQSTSRASSTPTGGRQSVPTFEVSPTATFPLANKENVPFTFAPAVVVNDEKALKSPPTKTSTLPPLSDAISRMCIAPAEDEDDLDATTHDISVMPDVEIKSGVNPWSETERLKVLKGAPPMVEQHEFLTTKAPNLNTKGSIVELGGEKFKVLKFIAQGGFARIYKTQAEDGRHYAVKLEMPACPWEVYICKSLSARLPQEILPFVMSIRDAYIFSNASAIIYDYYPLKTLLDLANSYKVDNNSTMDGMVVSFIGIQIGEILNYVHQAKIIHADIKPDNFVIAQPMPSELPQHHYMTPFVKLIDFGRAIDMSQYESITFKGRAGTNGFDCHEMQEDRPWTYQTDFYGYVGTMHVLMFGSYMKTFYNPTKKIYCFTEQLKRRYPLCETWTNIFREFLNIPNCDHMPSWKNVVNQLKRDLEDFATEDVSAWRRAVDKCNAVLRNSVAN